ncbi:CheB methylesterase domain-containing protein [Marivita sp.]|uniref:CheB methylesterase domain-containing protein n=1 Tax=Marivita sp. TaxID=2003365 RepID=UPI0025C4D123|nr:CheB methylesterase domain-containing protein [Marivita sp.]
MNPTRIVIVAKSPISRSLIGRRLVALPGIELVGEAVSLADAKRVIETSRPHIAVLGPSLAASREFKDLRDLLIAMPCRWIEIAGLNTAADSDGLARDGRHLPVLTHGMTQTQTEKALAEVMAAPVDRATSSETAPAFRRTPDAQTTEPANRFILIGASTGGVDALLQILGDFPEDCPPTAIVQHTGRGYSGSLIQLLAQRCRAKVMAPRDGMELRRGMIAVAAGGEAHLRINAGSVLRCHLRGGPPVSGHMPSVDALFMSAVPWADRAVAVILTGMGRDGASGLLELRRGGAVTIGQDEATSLVYGMPKAAWDMGAVENRHSLSNIAGAVLRATQAGVLR